MKTAIITSALLFLSGCAIPLTRIAPATSHANQITYQNNRQVITSAKNSTILIASEKTSYDLNVMPGFYIGFLNKSKAPINFGIENIKITANGQPVTIKTYDEIMQTISYESATELFFESMSGVVSQTSNGAGLTYHNGVINSDNSQASYQGYSYSQSDAQAARNQAAEQSNQRIETIRTQTRNRAASYSDLLLKTNTVIPGSSNEGLIKIDPPSSGDQLTTLEIEVVLPDETHKVQYIQTIDKIKNPFFR